MTASSMSPEPHAAATPECFSLCRQERSYDEAAASWAFPQCRKEHMVLSMRFIHDYVFRYGTFMALYISGKVICNLLIQGK